MSGRQKQEPHHQPNAKDERPHSVQLVGTIDKNHETCWDAHTAAGNVMLYPDTHCRKTERGPLYNRATKRCSGAISQPNFFSQRIFELSCAKWLFHTCHAKYETPSTRKCSSQAAPTRTKVHKQFTSCSLTPWTQTLKQKKNLKFYQTLNGCIITLDTIPNEYIKKIIHVRDRAHPEANNRESVAHIPSKKKRH